MINYLIVSDCPQADQLRWSRLERQGNEQRPPAHAWHRLRVQGGAVGHLLLRRLVPEDQLVLLCTSATTIHMTSRAGGAAEDEAAVMHLLTPALSPDPRSSDVSASACTLYEPKNKDHCDYKFTVTA